MPKSSSASRTPSSLRRTIAASAVSTFAKEHAFRQFKFELRRVETRFVQDALDDFDEIDAPELQRGYVDRNGETWPGLAIDARPAKHPISEIDDQSAVLGDGNKFGRRYLATDRMSPAAKRLDPDNHLAALVHNRLVQELKTVIIDSLTQVRFKQLTAGKIGVHRSVINARAIAAFIFGAVERHIGVTHDVGCGAALVVDHRNAHRGADDDVLSIDDVGRADRGNDALRKAQHLFAVARDRRDYREFVTAKTRDQITAPQGMRKPQGHVADQFIPNVMPKRIVDVLEVIEVDIENKPRARCRS